MSGNTLMQCKSRKKRTKKLVSGGTNKLVPGGTCL